MSNPVATRRRWLIGVLVASLAVNAFVIGATATDFIHVRWPFRDRGPAPQLRFELGWLKGRLPPAAMAKVEEAVAAARPETMAHLDRLRSLRQELAGLIAQPQPDRVAVDAKLADIRAELTEMQAGVQRVSTDALIALPLDVRQRLTEDRRSDKKLSP